MGGLFCSVILSYAARYAELLSSERGGHLQTVSFSASKFWMMKNVIYFHRNLKAGYSINKVTQTVVGLINPKEEYYLPTNRATPIAMIRNIWFVFRLGRRIVIII